MTRRLGILVSHPIQYYTPWFRQLARELEVEVFYAHRQDGRGQAEAGFGVEFEWDVPLLEGYPYSWLANVASNPTLRSFRGVDTPEIYSVVGRGGFDAFMIFGWNRKSALQAIMACRRQGVPVLMRGDSHLGTKRSLARATVKYLPYRWFLPRLSAHLYVGERNKAYLNHYGVPEERLFFAPHFIDDSHFNGAGREADLKEKADKLRAEMSIPREAFVYLFVGKMTPVKRPADFVSACLKIFDSENSTETHALLVGDGPLRAELEGLAEQHPGRVHFAGFRNQSDMPEFYRAADALVLPSEQETWGLVVNEAFACGLPAVVSDTVGCAPDLIEEGRTGHTFPAGDVDALARRMLDLKRMCKEQPASVREAVAGKAARYSMAEATRGLKTALESVAR